MSSTPERSSATHELADFAAQLSFEQLPGEVVHQAKRLLLDTLGNGLAGSRSEFGRASVAWVQAMGHPPEATIWAGGGRTSTAFAACVNARMVGAFSASETFASVQQTYHHGCTTISASLATCEQLHASGRDLITAMAAGYEIGARLAIGLVPGPDPSAHSGGLRPGGYGPGNVIGSAASAGRARGLSADQMAHAFGLAGMHVDGPALKWFEVYRAPMVKSSDGGWQAMTGMMAASMAGAGITGYDDLLDGETGMWRALGYAACDFDALLERRGEKWYMLDSAFKAWPCQHWMHQALTALRDILDEQRPEPAQIERIVLRTNPRSSAPRFKDPDPPGEIERSFNFPHAAALIVLGIPPGPRWLGDEFAADPVARRLRHLVEVEIEPASADYREWIVDHQVRDMPASATVWINGVAHERRVRHGLGEPWSDATRFSDADLIAKFKTMTAGVGDGGAAWDAHVEQLIEHVMTIDEIDDVADTAALLART